MKSAMKIGITGHQTLDDASEWPRVRADLGRLLLAEAKPLVGLTSLAIGADQIFAEVVLEIGGSIEVIVPFEGYDSKFEPGLPLQNYLRLLHQAVRVTTLPSLPTEEASYLEAGKRIVAEVEKLIAVWDGKEAEGLGGTGDVVSYARRIGKPVAVIPVKG